MFARYKKKFSDIFHLSKIYLSFIIDLTIIYILHVTLSLAFYLKGNFLCTLEPVLCGRHLT